MLPAFAQNNARYRSLSHVKPLPNGCLTHAIGVKLSDLKSLGSREFAAIRAMSTLCNHIRYVIGMSAKPKVGWIDARPIVAAMANIHAIGYRAMMQFIGVTVRRCVCMHLGSKYPMPCRVSSPLPFPAFIWSALVHSFPETLFDGGDRSAGMTISETSWLPLNHSLFDSGTVCDCSRLAASTHAHAAWIRIGKVIALAIAMSAHKVVGLACDNVPFFICMFRKLGFLSASAMAVAGLDFIKGKLGLGKFWGMILHVGTSLGLRSSRGCFNIARRFYWVITPVIVPQKALNVYQFSLQLGRS